MASIVYKFER